MSPSKVSPCSNKMNGVNVVKQKHILKLQFHKIIFQGPPRPPAGYGGYPPHPGGYGGYPPHPQGYPQGDRSPGPRPGYPPQVIFLLFIHAVWFRFHVHALT